MMKSKIVSIGALVVVLPCNAWGESPDSGARLSASSHSAKTLRHDEIRIITIADGTRGEKRAVNTGRNGPSQGDLFVFDQPLMDQAPTAATV